MRRDGIPWGNGCMCLHPGERLSNERDKILEKSGSEFRYYVHRILPLQD